MDLLDLMKTQNLGYSTNVVPNVLLMTKSFTLALDTIQYRVGSLSSLGSSNYKPRLSLSTTARWIQIREENDDCLYHGHN
jgi:hypothetical protein